MKLTKCYFFVVFCFAFYETLRLITDCIMDQCLRCKKKEHFVCINLIEMCSEYIKSTAV